MSEKKNKQKSNDEDSHTEEDVAAHVQSANKWENADLGETDRKSKFLRLMGATKKEHHGKFVIGDQKANETRKKVDEHQLTEDLEVQFVQGLEHQRIGGRRGHIGLGYHSVTLDSQGQQDTNSSEPQSGKESDTHSQEMGETSKEEKQSAETKTENTSESSKEKKDVVANEQDGLGPTSAKKFKLAFVKASS
ncbi:small acidic protein-like [Gigantopelta aegis]|uniref:small acidic protein-like n=1 Tax=Gigantopelta aegis TaxID=1735272 RepID=UPI001B88D321|nr:small acidic protein-like [Gigantopelta aegis]